MEAEVEAVGGRLKEAEAKEKSTTIASLRVWNLILIQIWSCS